MDNSVCSSYQLAAKLKGSLYVSQDGSVKFCATGPLLELPMDFKEWHLPLRDKGNERKITVQ